MKAMVLEGLSRLRENSSPLTFRELPDPEPGPGEVRVRVSVCGVCHTEIDEIEGRTPPPRFPVIPGHQAVGRVDALGDGAAAHRIGDRVGIAWIFSACGSCAFCEQGLENLCSQFRATGRDADGGYAEYLTIPDAFAFPLPDGISDLDAAPLLCAGAIGYRSLRLTGIRNGDRLGLTGFGASAHLVLKMVRHRFPETSVYVFARNPRQRELAMDLGAAWAGETEDAPPEPLQAVIDTTPAWLPVLAALRQLLPGGRLVINAIGKEVDDREVLAGIDYPAHLWMEKEIKSVANVARDDVREFLALAAEADIRPEVQEYPLESANTALMDLVSRKSRGAKVLRINPDGA